jgi:hypothetical protein
MLYQMIHVMLNLILRRIQRDDGDDDRTIGRKFIETLAKYG